MLNKDKPEKLELRMYSKLEHAIISGYRYIHFPIVSAGTNSAIDKGHHWTLLVLDMIGGHWKIFNSLRPRTNETEDVYFRDAKLMIDWIKNFILKRMSSYKVLNNLALKAENVIRMQNSPKQAGTADCGFIIMYLMTCYAESEQIPSRITHAQMKKFKQRILEGIMKSKFAATIDEQKEKDYETVAEIIQDLNKYSPMELYGGNKGGDD